MKTSAEYEKCICIRQNLTNLTLKLNSLLQFQENAIRKSVKVNNNFLFCCLRPQEKKYSIDQQFANAFMLLSCEQKQQYYINTVQFIDNYTKKKQIKHQISEELDNSSVYNLEMESGTFHTWTKCKLTSLANILKIQISDYEGQQIIIDLRNYLIRKSKNKIKKMFVLEAIKPKITPRFRFNSSFELNFTVCFDRIKKLLFKAHLEGIEQELKQIKQTTSKTEQLQDQKFIEFSPQKSLQHKSRKNSQKTFVQQLLKLDQFDIIQKIQEQNNEIQQHVEFTLRKSMSQKNTISDHKTTQKKQKQQKEEKQKFNKIFQKNKINIYKKLLPTYNLEDIKNNSNFHEVQSGLNYKILQDNLIQTLYKLQMETEVKKEDLIMFILDVNNYSKWNSWIEIGNIKLTILSQNSQIAYEKHKMAFDAEKSQDFLYLRHIFLSNGVHFIVDKSIDNSNYPSFVSISREKIEHAIWAISSSQKNLTKLTLELYIIPKEGEMVRTKNKMYSYLKEISKLSQYFRLNIVKKYISPLNINWKYDQNNSVENIGQNNQSLFSENLCSVIQEDVFYTMRSNSQKNSSLSFKQGNNNNISDMRRNNLKQIQESIGQYQDTSVFKNGYELDQATGTFILPNEYLKKNHRINPSKSYEIKHMESNYKFHYIWKDIWQIPPEGALKCKNLKLLEQQHAVFTDLSKFYKNLTKSNSMFNISLPIQVFSPISIVELTAMSFRLAPLILEKAAIIEDPLERFKYAIILNISKTLLFLQMEKTFNGLLGETYQGWIKGCPIYCEQISSHPQITSFYMCGRGYKIYGNVQVKVDLNMNSAIGIDEGQCVIQFESYPKQKIYIKSPQGEISGLLKGERRFLLDGKGYYYDSYNSYFCELQFKSDKPLFNKQKKLDILRGSIVEVDKKFISKFKKMSIKEGPSQNFVKKILSHVSGRWTDGIIFDKVEYYNVNKDIPYILEKDKFPLNSDCYFREDIYYRKNEDFAKSQIQKQRLQNMQRRERKLRDKRSKF